MDVSSIGSLSSALSQANTSDAVSTLVLKKAMDIQAQSATQLLAALPPIPSSSNPPNLGNSIDVKA
ncbi:MAG TPA: YjfB family protein [Azonexus sp.]|nr:YjfB family protein [Azonexus sp.]